MPMPDIDIMPDTKPTPPMPPMPPMGGSKGGSIRTPQTPDMAPMPKQAPKDKAPDTPMPRMKRKMPRGVMV